MSVEKRFLNFDDLKSQVRVSGVTLNERNSKFHRMINWRPNMSAMTDKKSSRQTLQRKALSADGKPQNHGDGQQCGGMVVDMDRLRYVRISPPPLDKVVRPKKILFESKQVNSVNENLQSELARRMMTRRDLATRAKVPLRESVQQNDGYKLDVDVEVKPRYYQKWARNTKRRSFITDTFSFPSMSKSQKIQKVKRKVKARRNSLVCSVPRNHKMSRIHSSGSLCSNENACSNVAEWPPFPHIEHDDFTDDEKDTATNQDETMKNSVKDTTTSESIPEQTEKSTLVDGQTADTELDRVNATDLKDRTLNSDPNDSLVTTTDTGQAHVNKDNDKPKCSHCPTSLTVDTNVKVSKDNPIRKTDDHVSGYATVKVANEEGDVSETAVKKAKPEKRTGAQEVTLSRHLISADVLDGAVSRLPVLEKRLDSPFRYGKDSGLNQTKPAHYNYYPSRPIYNDMKKRREKLSQMTINQSPFDHRRCRTEVNICMSSCPESRIPMKISTSSPRFSIPDNLIVDFETLRIAAHMDRLRKTLSELPHGPREFFVNKNVSDATKDIPNVSSIKNNRVKTVIFGSSMAE